MKTRFLPPIFVLSVSIVNLFPPLNADSQTKIGREPLDFLIKQLSSNSFKDRDVATSKLLKRTDTAPALRKLIDSPDKELARRALLILEESAQRQLTRRKELLKQFAKTGAIDQVADLVCSWPKGVEEDACWQTVFDLAKALFAIDERSGGKAKMPDFEAIFRNGKLPTSKILSTKRLTEAPVVQPDDHAFFARADEVFLDLDNLGMRGLIVSAGPAKLRKLFYSVLFALGPVEIDHAEFCLIISDDEVIVSRSRACTIIARGKITVIGQLSAARIVSQNSVIFTKGGSQANCIVKSDDAQPLQLIQFFDLKKSGIDLEDRDGVVQIKSVERHAVLSAAGLRPGDVIETLDDQPVRSVEAFRKLLRPRFALGEPIVFRVLRSKEVLEIEVDLE